jgi:hypothetical protein
MIISSYLLSKYTNSLAKTPTKRQPQKLKAQTAAVVQRQQSAFVCDLNTATEPNRLQTSVHPRHY